MYAIAFDLVVKGTQDYHPKGVQQAYTDIVFVLSNGLILLILYEINICLDKPYRLPCLIPFRQYNGGVLLILIRYDYV
ncbi:virulence-associated protein D [Haemophilus influenzae 22.1-21]|nr:virulence-associated protein D [Haemophilus influenzae 22.1-21]